jgi:hypothetical protein
MVWHIEEVFSQDLCEVVERRDKFRGFQERAKILADNKTKKGIDSILVPHRVLDKGVFDFPNRKVHDEDVAPRNKLGNHLVPNQNPVAASWKLERK